MDMLINRRATPLGIVLMVAASGCADPADPSHASRSTGADPEAGRAAIERYDCGVCHTIPGVRGARGLVGPPLDAFRHRVYIAGKFANRKEILERWIRDPPALAPETAMPNLGVEEQEARDMAAYLYRLR
ncbi:MAG: c-type cytochrome [Gammaproteobacteria bacterium]